MRTKLLIVDHMALVRKTVAEGLRGSPLVEVVGTASNPQLAARKISANPPDVILLDAAPLAEADLRELRGEFAIPVVLFTGLADAAALGLGAEAVLAKPAANLAESIRAMLSEIEGAAVRAHHDDLLRWQRKRRAPAAAVAASGSLAGSATGGLASRLSPRQRRVIAIGASTGGTEALAEILARLPRQTPGILIVQHMPSGFTRLFAERLDRLSEMDVKEAEDGDAVRDGLVLLAPGGLQMRLVCAGQAWKVRIEPGEKVSGHCPSVDVLMRSVAEQVGARAAGVLLTGMGSDGAEGMKALKLAGAVTLAQDEKSCVVFGMPREAYERGGVDRLVPLRDIPGQLLSALK